MLGRPPFQGYRYVVQKKTSVTTFVPMTGRKVGRHRGAAVVLAGLLSLGALVGCTSSAPEGAPVWSAPSSGDTSVAKAVIGVPQEGLLPQAFLDDLAKATSLTITQVSVDLQPGGVVAEDAETTISEVDVLMGFDLNWFDPSLAESAKADSVDLVDLSFASYGIDDACVLVDASWFSANNIGLPKTVEDLPGGALEMIVASSNPQVNPYALAALPEWDGWWGTWGQDAQSGLPQSGETPEVAVVGKVGSALEPIRNPNNLGTDTRYRVLGGTCVEREVVLVDLSARPEQKHDDAAYVVLADFLGGNAGAEMLAQYGIAYPPGVEAGGQSEQGLTRLEAKAPFSVKETAAALKLWEKTFG